MSVEEIKDIKKLQKMLKYERELRKYTYACCEEAGKELEKNSFDWDGKEKNLVIQAIELNERYDKLKQTLAEIKEMLKEICMEECSFDWNKTSKKHCGDYDCRYGQIIQKISEGYGNANT